jgi:predicted RNA-binding Zn-ribbon protein involved in translation (DUF1610 family)
MFNTHDPLAEEQRAARAQEDDYFRQRDQELLVALRDKSTAESEQAMRHSTRMRCPQCGEPLQETPSRWGTMAACPACGGLWLDKGQGEVLVGSKAHSWFQRFVDGLLAPHH